MVEQLESVPRVHIVHRIIASDAACGSLLKRWCEKELPPLRHVSQRKESPLG